MPDGPILGSALDTVVTCGQELSAEASCLMGASRWSGHGIIIFSHGLTLLHMNRRAMELTGHLDRTDAERTQKMRSVSVHELRQNIQETLGHRPEASIEELFELRRIIFEVGRKILIRGFGMVGPCSAENSRVVIVLEEIEEQQESPQVERPMAVRLLSGVCVKPGEDGPRSVRSGEAVVKEQYLPDRIPPVARTQQVRISERSLQ